MRTSTVGIVLLLVSLAFALEDRGNPASATEEASVRIFADSQVMRMAGMPEMPEMPEMPFSIPGLGGIPGLSNEPMRMLHVELFAPGIAPEDATASLGIPAGLKLGPKLDLALSRPEKEVEEEEAEVEEAEPKFTILRYWGSSATVKAGQPETMNWGGLTPEQQAALSERMRKAAEKGGYFYKEDWTTGYWPHGKATGTVDKKASLVGKYALTTNFIGNSELEVPKGVDLLGGIKLTSPDLSGFPPLDKAMTFRWEPVAGVLGYQAMIVGMKGEDTMITWSSSEVKEEEAAGRDYLSSDQIAELVNEKILMGPDRKEVIVPAGIFKDCDSVFFTMTGYGRSAAGVQRPGLSLQTRTMLMVTLAGKEIEEEMGGEGEGGY